MPPAADEGRRKPFPSSGISRSLPGERASRKQGYMNHLRKIGLASFALLGLAMGAGSIGAAEESREDSAEGLPEQYAKNYLGSVGVRA